MNKHALLQRLKDMQAMILFRSEYDTESQDFFDELQSLIASVEIAIAEMRILTLDVQIRNVFGNLLCYPVCDTAKRFADLVGRKTLTDSDLEKIRSMGFEIVYVAQVFPHAGESK